MLTCRREGGQQAAEGMRGPDADVDALGVQLRVRGQSTQKLFPAAATQIEYPLVATRHAMFQHSRRLSIQAVRGGVEGPG